MDAHEPDRVFVDVDTGIDDAFALLYACAETGPRPRRRLDRGRQREPRQRHAQHPRGVEARRPRRRSGVRGRTVSAGARAERRAGGPRTGRPRLCEPARSGGARRNRPRRRCARRRGARERRADDPRRHGAAHQHRARRHARARVASPRQAVRHHGRRLRRPRQRHAERGVQHLARPGGGAHLLSRLRRSGRRARHRGRPRRDAEDDDRRRRPRGGRRASRPDAATLRR